MCPSSQRRPVRFKTGVLPDTSCHIDPIPNFFLAIPKTISNGSSGVTSPQLIVLSSHDQDGISRLANAYKQHAIANPFYDLAFTLGTKRSQFNWRAAFVANSIESMQDALAKKLEVKRVTADPGLALVFTGQGAQWARMGMELVHYAVFRESIALADAYLKELGSGWSTICKLAFLGLYA